MDQNNLPFKIGRIFGDDNNPYDTYIFHGQSCEEISASWAGNHGTIQVIIPGVAFVPLSPQAQVWCTRQKGSSDVQEEINLMDTSVAAALAADGKTSNITLSVNWYCRSNTNYALSIWLSYNVFVQAAVPLLINVGVNAV